MKPIHYKRRGERFEAAASHNTNASDMSTERARTVPHRRNSAPGSGHGKFADSDAYIEAGNQGIQSQGRADKKSVNDDGDSKRKRA